MTRDIKLYKEKINELLEKNNPKTDWDVLSTEMLAKIGFYQHERLVHLIVTMTVAILSVMSICATFVAQTVPVSLMVLIALLLILVAPYMVYYFTLENAVQDIYSYYDRVRERMNTAISHEM